jgi:uncharacterized membrane protein
MLFKIILVLHVIAGSIGLILGTFVLIRKKGDKVHKRLGKIFSIAMVTTGFSAFALSYINTNVFLFIVGVFTIYLTISGNRMLYLKNILKGQKPQLIDYLLTILMLIASVAFLYLGILNLIKANNFGLVLMLFGTTSVVLCYKDYLIYSYKNTDKLFWLKNHIGRMTGAYIAALTAFIVVNNTFIPPVIAWSLPGIIGSVFISRTIKKLTPKKVS